MIKAIETVYNGYRFRSRLEARWAVFFDALGVKYEYEKEGFDLDGVWYLPDFWLPRERCWIEIKGEDPTRNERNKLYRLSAESKQPACILFGSPGFELFAEPNWYSPTYGFEVYAGEGWDTWKSAFFSGCMALWETTFNVYRLPEFLIEKYPEEKIPHKDANSLQERKRLIELDERYFLDKYNREHFLWSLGRHFTYVHLRTLMLSINRGLLQAGNSYCLDPRVCRALILARQARFEHGETPKIRGEQ